MMLSSPLEYTPMFPQIREHGEFHPKKHTVETYRSQQRKAKKRRKCKNKK